MNTTKRELDKQWIGWTAAITSATIAVIGALMLMWGRCGGA